MCHPSYESVSASMLTTVGCVIRPITWRVSAPMKLGHFQCARLLPLTTDHSSAQ